MGEAMMTLYRRMVAARDNLKLRCGQKAGLELEDAWWEWRAKQ